MKNKIMIVGECLSEKDLRTGKPFTDGNGYVLDGILKNAGIRRGDCYTTCVFYENASRGVENAFTGPKTVAVPDYPAFARGKYIRKEYGHHLDRLWGEVERIQPNIIIAFGNAALWALTGQIGIKKFRGTPVPSTRGGFKVLPTWAPVSVIRQWPIRPIAVADCVKAKRESEFRDIRRPKRIIYLEPDLTDLTWFYDEHISRAADLSVDIETKASTITEIGFATDAGHALVVPFYSRLRPGMNYWPDLASERTAWQWVAKVLHNHPSFGQNFQYDMKYLWQTVGIPCTRFCDDTMVLHHTLQPEMEKGLGFLGSVYTDEPTWKFMRTAHDTLKKED